MKLQPLLLVVYICLIAVSCAPRSQLSAQLPPAGGDFGPELLPALPQADSGQIAHHPLASEYIVVDASQYDQKSAGAQADEIGDQMLLGAGSGELCWAMYEIPGVDLTLANSELQLRFVSAAGGRVYIALPDYCDAAWDLQYFDVSATETVSISLDAAADYTADVPGDFYFAALTWNGMEAAVDFIKLERGLVGEIPQNLSASDGDFRHQIVISWDMVAASAGYQLDYKPSAQGDEAWQRLHDASEPDYNLYVHSFPGMGSDPLNDVSYDYRVRAVYDDADTSGWSAAESGYRLHEAPTGLAATAGEFANRVEVSWQQDPPLTRYNIYYKEDGEDESAWRILYEYDTAVDGPPLFSHGASAPIGKEAEFRVVYNYRVTSLLYDEESGYQSVPVSGWRDIATPQDLTATYNIYADRIILSWSAVEGADLYMIDRSDDLIDWDWLDMSGTNSYSDFTAAGFGAYYYRVCAGVADGGEGDESSSAAGSRLGWTKCDVDDGITALPACDIMVLDGRLTIAYVNQTENALLLAHAQVIEPTGPGDWEISEVRTSSDFTSVSMDLLGDWPGIAFNDDGALRCAVAFDYQSGTGFSFKHTVVDTGDYLYNPHLRLMGGKPAVSYIRSLGGTKSLRFAYSSAMIPNSDADWKGHEVTPVSSGAYSQTLIEGNTAPKIAFNEDDQTRLKLAVSNVGLPGSTANWSISEIGLGYELSYLRLILTDGRPLVSFKSEPGPSSQNVYLKIANSGTPAGSGDWDIAGRIGTESDNIYDHDLAWIYTGPAVCYRDNSLAALMYGASSTAVPTADGWAVCTVDDASDCGSRCRLVEYNNAPAIVYWDKDNERLRLARGI